MNTWKTSKPLYLEKTDERYEVYNKQLKETGFSDTETWGLDNVILEFTLPRLKRFRQIEHCYPNSLNSRAEWNDILDKMINGIELYLEDSWDKNADEGLDLFFKYFRDLWW
jgi:hypothetical protein